MHYVLFPNSKSFDMGKFKNTDIKKRAAIALRILKKYDLYNAAKLNNFQFYPTLDRDLMWSMSNHIGVSPLIRYVLDILYLMEFNVKRNLGTIQTDCGEIFREQRFEELNVLIDLYKAAQIEYIKLINTPTNDINNLIDFLNKWFNNDEFIKEVIAIGNAVHTYEEDEVVFDEDDFEDVDDFFEDGE